jgi:hypothetical protein
MQHLDPCRVDSVEPPGSLCAVRDQTRRFEYSEMLRDCGTAHVHPFSDLSHRSRAAAQAFEHESASGISQCVQDLASISHDLP